MGDYVGRLVVKTDVIIVVQCGCSENIFTMLNPNALGWGRMVLQDFSKSRQQSVLTG